MQSNTSGPRGATLRDRVGTAQSTINGALTRKDGIEVSIPNIIVAITVSLIVILGVVAGVVFIVPWAQDASAKGDLQTVQAAEQVYYSKNAPSSYGDAAKMVTAKALLSSTDTTKHVKIKADAGGYCVGALSGSGTTFWLTSETTTITSTMPGPATTPAYNSSVAAACPDAATVAASAGMN